MNHEIYSTLLGANSEKIGAIRNEAALLHESVNQKYDGDKPYSFHLNMVADAALKHAASVLAREEDYLPVVFGAYFHDSMEDARLTYNDVKKIAGRWMDEEGTLMAAEIVYALTNDKGRTRAERAGDRYYEGIRTTPYAPFVKLCDRFANMSYSFRDMSKEQMSSSAKDQQRMKKVYAGEWPHFFEAIGGHSNPTDCRFSLPETMVEVIDSMVRE